MAQTKDLLTSRVALSGLLGAGTQHFVHTTDELGNAVVDALVQRADEQMRMMQEDPIGYFGQGHGLMAGALGWADDGVELLHLTPKENLPRIMKKGLLPNLTRNFSNSEKGALYFLNPELGDDYIKGLNQVAFSLKQAPEDLALLKTKVPQSDLLNFIKDPNHPGAVFVKDSVLPENLLLSKEGDDYGRVFSPLLKGSKPVQGKLKPVNLDKVVTEMINQYAEAEGDMSAAKNVLKVKGITGDLAKQAIAKFKEYLKEYE